MFESIMKYGYGLIESTEIEAAQEAGLLIHHEIEYQYADFDNEEVVTRNDWYAATPEFVASYYRSGGTWNYH